MPKNSKKRLLRGARGFGSDSYKADLFVPMPQNMNSVEGQLLLQQVLRRLSQLHYTHVALTHTIWGRPKPSLDAASVAIPAELVDKVLLVNRSEGKGDSSTTGNKKKRKREEDIKMVQTTTNNNTHNLTILRRLHVVLENLSDVHLYTNMKDSPYQSLFQDYDLVSLAPMNDAVFGALMQQVSSNSSSNNNNTTSPCAFDILTLDYYSNRGLKLPYKIKSGHVKTLLQHNNLALELPLAPALLNIKHRKSLMAASQQLQMACVGVHKLKLLISSGERQKIMLEGMQNDNSNNDVGALAIYSPGDLQNVCTTVMGFSNHCMGDAAMQCIENAQQRRRIGQRPPIFESVRIAVIVDDHTTTAKVVENEGDDGVNDSDNDSNSKSDAAGSGAVQKEDEQVQQFNNNNDDDNEQGDDGDDDGFMAL